MKKAKSQKLKLHDIDLYRILPTESGIRNFNRILGFYLYSAPLIDSARSAGEPAPEDQAAALEKMLKIGNLTKEGIILQKIMTNSFPSRNLEGDFLDLSKERFLCGKSNGETKLRTILRHIRNAFAHGNVAIYRKKIIILDDYETRGNTKKHSARFILRLETLYEWMDIICSYPCPVKTADHR